MKFKELQISPSREPSAEAERDLEELKNYCSKKGFKYWESPYIDTKYRGRTLNIMVVDKYNSKEIKEVIRYCEKAGWKKGIALSKSSQNIFEVYQKAKNELEEISERKRKGSIPEEEEELLNELYCFRDHLEKTICERVMKRYDSLTEKLEKKTTRTLPEAERGEEVQKVVLKKVIEARKKEAEEK